MIRCSAHAVEVMRERSIRIDWIERTIADPAFSERDSKDPSLVRSYRQITDYGNRWLRVVYRESDADFFVVTVYFDRNFGRRT